MTCHCKRYMGDSTPLSVFLGTLSVTAVFVARFVELPGPTVLQASQSMKQTVGADCPVFQAAQNILALAGTGVGISPAVGPPLCPLLLWRGRSLPEVPSDLGRRPAPSRTASHRVALPWPWSSFDEC